MKELSSGIGSGLTKGIEDRTELNERQPALSNPLILVVVSLGKTEFRHSAVKPCIILETFLRPRVRVDGDRCN